jgi:hypothetical protein
MKNAGTRFLAMACAALTASFAACEADAPKKTGDVGGIKMSLDVASGISLGTISYTINGPASFTTSGSIDVSHSSTIGANISPLPPGMGFVITLQATSNELDAHCMGAQTFDVAAHQTTAVVVHLLCKQPTKFGSIGVSGALNVCPVIDSIGSSPSEVFVGGSLVLSGLAHDTDGGPVALTYQWTVAPSGVGTLDNASAQNPVFTCASAGTASATLTVSDGDAACVDSQTIPVTCTSSSTGSGGTTAGAGSGGSTGGSGGSAGTGGNGGSAGTGGNGGSAGTGGNGGSAGTGGGGGSAGTGGGGGSAGAGGGATGAGGSGGMAMACGPGTNSAAIVVFRAGDGSGALTANGNAVFLDAFSTSGGAPVCSTALPTAGGAAPVSHGLVAAGNATSEGFLTRSVDGKYIVLAGYDATPNGSTSLPGSSVARVIGRVDAAGNVDTTTALTDANGGNPRSVASSDGVNLWLSTSNTGVHYTTLGTTSSVQLSTTVTNIRAIGIFGGQLYNSDASGSAVRLGAVGAGLPTTSGQTIVNLPGFATTGGSPYAFFFADLDGTVAGVDTLYVADDGSGLQKYSLVSGSWVASGIVGTSADSYRGVTGVVNGGSVTLYAIRKASSTGGGELVQLVDSSGYNASISATPSVLATAAASTAFRGVALAPTP